MALTKYKLGELIEKVELRNTELQFGISDVRGVNNLKQFMPTKADLTARDLSKFQIVSPGNFVFNHRTSRNGNKFSIAYNEMDYPVICTEDYVVFRIRENCQEVISPLWLYLFFYRPEFDRYVIIHSWGSSTEFYNWEDICDMDIDLPPIEVQKKYVALYQAMVDNQKQYEQGLDDLKLVCDGYIENLKGTYPLMKIGPYIHRCDLRNGPNGTKNVMGISTRKEFREPTAKVNRDSLSNYKVVKPKQFGFVQTTHNEKVFAYALNNTLQDIVISSVHEVFSTEGNTLLPEYLAMFFNRSEFDRYARFHSWGSARETFTWDDLIEVKIPIPSISIQRSIANIYKVYCQRKEINERLKSQIKDLCPILIKGSIEEGKRI